MAGPRIFAASPLSVKTLTTSTGWRPAYSRPDLLLRFKARVTHLLSGGGANVDDGAQGGKAGSFPFTSRWTSGYHCARKATRARTPGRSLRNLTCSTRGAWSRSWETADRYFSSHSRRSMVQNRRAQKPAFRARRGEIEPRLSRDGARARPSLLRGLFLCGPALALRRRNALAGFCA